MRRARQTGGRAARNRNSLDAQGIRLANPRPLVICRKILAPTLCKGDIVALDNLGSRKNAGMHKRRGRSRDPALFPPYKPNSHSIQMVFFEHRALLLERLIVSRRQEEAAAQRARSGGVKGKARPAARPPTSAAGIVGVASSAVTTSPKKIGRERTGPRGRRDATGRLVRQPPRPRPRQLVFIDETWTTTNWRERTAAPRGARVHAPFQIVTGRRRPS